MTQVQLDTSFLIRALVPGSNEDARLRAWLARDARIGMSAVGWAEFLCGPVADSDKATARLLIGPPIPLEEAGAELAASMFNRSGRRRGTFVDSLVAAIAVQAGAQLATANPTDFRRFADAGLALVGDADVTADDKPPEHES